MSADGDGYRQQLRLRVCGILVIDGRILVAQVHSPISDNLIWTPPGGGLKFGESLAEGVRREFAQETNLQVAVRQLVHINELIEAPFHAVECYFEVDRQDGEATLGEDPEHDPDRQLLQDLQWVPLEQLPNIVFAHRACYPNCRAGNNAPILILIKDHEHRGIYFLS
ncbi:MAG: NUDIX domain-containing protein [Fodinibius sp.]|nr:NUDIX domain-containing protein [Fodinibius sp.]